MSFAEIVLRLGVASVAWLVVYVHLLALLVVPLGECPAGDHAPWTMTALTGALALAATPLLSRAHGLPDVAPIFGRMALPLALLLPAALWIVWPYLGGTTAGPLSLCDVRLGTTARWPQTTPMQLWAPAQLLTLAVIAWCGWHAWRGRQTNTNA